MSTLNGKVLDARGKLVGSGIVLDDAGALVEVLPVTDAEVSGWITPGLIDIHNHGGGGASFPDQFTQEGVKTAVDTHLKMGTTAMLASTVSMIDPLPAIHNLVEACEAGMLLGIHLEGPYISPYKVGAQNPAAVRNPDLDELRSWLEAGKGWVKTMTLAPEVDNAAEAAKMLLDYGALPSWGHTNTSGAVQRELIEITTAYAAEKGISPAQTATHLFNAMPPLSHREPGPARELIASARRGETVVELVADAIHLHPDLVGDVINFIEPKNELGAVFITDAMEGAGMPDGQYVLGSLAVTITDGVARLTEGGAIAGGTARMAQDIQRMVGAGAVTMEQAVRASVAAPAYTLRLTGEEPGVSLEYTVGEKMNLVTFDEELNVTGVIREGKPVTL
ncbi:MAG: amidohydrolase family protein [Actinomycetaceae bacterium]|nr:amidohydrolase family protein [Actinomycetaceae bacterium]